MATIHEVLRPSIQGGLSSRQIEQLGIASRSSVSNIKARLQSSGLKAEEALKLSETQLQAKLFAPKASPKSDRPQPDWAEVHRQLRQKGMTRLLLWQEYKARHPEGFGYTQFKHHYNRYLSTLNPSTFGVITDNSINFLLHLFLLLKYLLSIFADGYAIPLPALHRLRCRNRGQ